MIQPGVGEFDQKQIDDDLSRRNIESGDVGAKFSKHLDGRAQNNGVLFRVDLDVILQKHRQEVARVARVDVFSGNLVDVGQ